MHILKILAGRNATQLPLVLSLMVLAIFPSCKKNEGFGGEGSISGTLIENFFNEEFTDQLYQMPAIDEDIFIQFGEDDVVGDRTRTGHNGEFRFDYLYPGRYYIYHRSLDSSSVPDDGWSNKIAVDLKWGDKEDLGALVKLSTLEYDEGYASIKGVVRLTKYVDESRWPNLVVEYEDFAHEHEVYLIYGDRIYYDERVRTQHNGSFEFRNLIPGRYRVFLYSEDVTRVLEHVVLEYEVEITEYEQVVDLGEIKVEEL